MAYCPNDSEIFVGVGRPHGNGGIIENARSDANPMNEAIAARNQAAQERAAVQIAAQSVRSAIEDTGQVSPLNAGDQGQISAASRWLSSMIDRAEQVENKRLNDFQLALDKVSGSTVSDASKWLDVTNAISKGLAFKSAQFNKFAVTNFGAAGRTILDNPLVSAFERMEPRTQGQYQIYLKASEDIMRKWAPVSQRTGRNLNDLMIAGGEYANAQHAPEVNALLLSRWTAEIAAEKAKPVAKQTQKFITDREGWIADLRDNLDSTEILAEDGTPRTIKSSGYTNAQAAQLMEDVLTHTGMTRAEAEGIAQDIRGLNQQILQDRVDQGLVSADLLSSFPDFEFYVPLKTKYENTTGVVNNSNIYNPGKYYSIEGSTTPPDSAWLSVMHHARRAANEIGMQEFGTELVAAKRFADSQGRDVGLRQYDYGQVMVHKFGNNPVMRDWAQRVENQGGVVVDVPMLDVEGNDAGVRKMLVTFDANFVDPRSKVSGADLNAAITNTVKTSQGFSALAKATSYFGQMFTRFSPGFAPINTNRDLFERALHMNARDYYTESGNLVRGSSQVGNYLLNQPRTGKYLFDALNGNLDANSPASAYWREYVENGLHQQYTKGQNTTRRSLADLIDESTPAARNRSWTLAENLGSDRLHSWASDNLSKMPGVKQRLDQAGSGGQAALRTLDKWNDYFNNAAIFNHFVTLREAGVSARNATQGTLEILNLYQGGVLQPILSTLFPFVKPTIQSGVALARTLGLAPNAKGQFQVNGRGALSLLGATAAVMALEPVIRSSLGTDPESGIDRLDQISLPEIQRFLPIGINNDGDYIKMPIGFGLSQIATTLAFGLDRIQRGLMKPEDLVFETLYVAGKNVSPGDWPEFSIKAKPLEWIGQAFAPSLLKPFFTTVDFRGRPITTADNEGFKSLADQGRLSTEQVYHRMAKALHSATGMDLAPEQVKNLARHILAGPLRLFKGILESGELRTTGERTTAAQELGWLNALGGSLYYGRTYDTGRAMYYQALNEFKDRIRSEGIPDITSRSYGSDADKREAYQTKVLQKAGWDSTDINDFLLLMQTERDLRSNSSKFNQEVKPVWMSSDDSDTIRSQFETLASTQGTLYNNAVLNLSYYAGIR